MADPMSGSLRPHLASRVEAQLHAAIDLGLRRAGMDPQGGAVRRVRHRWLGPGAGPRAADSALDASQRGQRRAGLATLPHRIGGRHPVTIRVGERTHVVTSARDGYLDVRLDSDLEPGWSTVQLSTEGADPVDAPVRIVGPGPGLGLVSDIDDTVMVTMLPRPLIALRNAFLVKESARRPVPGMAALYATSSRRTPTPSSSTSPRAPGTPPRPWPSSLLATATRPGRCC